MFSHPTHTLLHVLTNWLIPAASASAMTANSNSLEEQKRLEYEQWLKQQQKEQQMFECSVKYEEKAENESSATTMQGNTSLANYHCKKYNSKFQNVQNT